MKIFVGESLVMGVIGVITAFLLAILIINQLSHIYLGGSIGYFPVKYERAMGIEGIIIMCDEPTGNLDSKNTGIVFDIFRQITRESGQTVIAVTHDNDFARASDRTIEMADGRIVGR